MIMFVTLAVSWMLTYKQHIDSRLKQWAIYSMFVTMTHDMSIGLTLSDELWLNDESSDYSQYIVIWSAISRMLTLTISVGVLDFAVLIEKEVKFYSHNLKIKIGLSNIHSTFLLLGKKTNNVTEAERSFTT